MFLCIKCRSVTSLPYTIIYIIRFLTKSRFLTLFFFTHFFTTYDTFVSLICVYCV